MHILRPQILDENKAKRNAVKVWFGSNGTNLPGLELISRMRSVAARWEYDIDITCRW